ncbi:CIA30 family protein [Thalassotalea litorea]|uniref:CIA30 family protein n=1 Tax=Thalassotalea litorea TaxID=2020715 RepID=A0A5R9IE26_9GAMM|nr:CIA30 family protein [Thalassotalea litorea]TLU61866.1 CIA30 family protein [Thalassotalea litorea]
MKTLLKLACLTLVWGLIPWQSVRSSEMKIVDFSDREELQKWLVVNDTVMGGISEGQFLLEDNNGIFFGMLSLKNNGGFASIRRLLSTPVQSQAQRISIRVKGDGGRYQFRVRTNREFDSYAYQVSFNTIENEWLTLFFEPKDFIATYRGMVLEKVPKLALEDIEQVGFLISEQQQGQFSLHIHSIKFLAEQ